MGLKATVNRIADAALSRLVGSTTAQARPCPYYFWSSCYYTGFCITASGRELPSRYKYIVYCSGYRDWVAVACC